MVKVKLFISSNISDSVKMIWLLKDFEDSLTRYAD